MKWSLICLAENNLWWQQFQFPKKFLWSWQSLFNQCHCFHKHSCPSLPHLQHLISCCLGVLLLREKSGHLSCESGPMVNFFQRKQMTMLIISMWAFMVKVKQLLCKGRVFIGGLKKGIHSFKFCNSQECKMGVPEKAGISQHPFNLSHFVSVLCVTVRLNTWKVSNQLMPVGKNVSQHFVPH